MSQQLSEGAKTMIDSVQQIASRLSSFVDNVDEVDKSLAKRSRFRNIFQTVYQCRQKGKKQKQQCILKQLNNMCKEQYQKVDLRQPPTVNTLLYIYCIKGKSNEARMATLVDL